MGRLRGSIVKVSRQLGVNVAETEKVQKYMDRRQYGPGQHGQRRKGRPSDYSVRLREKQKLRFIYDVSETQFRNLFEEASRKSGVTGTVFLQLLESRLDNIVFRMGIASTRRQARQFVRHGHILVGGKRVTIPGYQVRQGEEIKVSEKGRKIDFIVQNVERFKNRKSFPWIEFDGGSMTGKFLRVPDREMLSLPVNEQLVIEFYSR
ncbi:MAG: 30S ribosomal protein S4 [Meiothermus sp.]|nr:30S ribosomal protein S4 [Meiothermus sp.]